MKEKLKAIIPEELMIFKRKLTNNIRLLSCYLYDFKRYINHSATSTQNEKCKLIGKIIANYHVLEKGLSYTKMKPMFAEKPFSNLNELLDVYEKKKYPLNDFHFITACSVIMKYIKKHEDLGIKIPDDILYKNLSKYYNQDFGGVREVTRCEVLSAVDIDFERFFSSRHSIREFSKENVDDNLILHAIKVAQKYPSVCNRQAVRVYFVKSKPLIKEYLSYQNGNRGFTDEINKLLIITTDLNLFENANERNQPFIDGGIYLMGLLLSLHSVGLGSVTLNWSTDKKSDKIFRKNSKIRDSENIIAFVGVGNLKEKTRVPKSERAEINEVLTTIG